MSNTMGVEKLKEWFNVGKELSKIQIQASATGGLGLPVEEPNKKLPKKRTVHRPETDYVREYLEREAASLQQRLVSGVNTSESVFTPLSHLSEMDEVTTVGAIGDLGDLDEGLTQVYENYDFTHQLSTKLLVTHYKEQIINAIDTQQVIIIEGTTGSGKTTQVPQYILDHHVEMKRHCNIIVTQPRRLAAISVAKRVCHERGWRVGGIVGYQVGLNKAVNSDTRLTYVTTGVLLQRLISSKHMNDYTHIILDEVHDRDQEMDMCLLLVKKFLHTVSRQVKVVLMSATFDVSLFGDYFALPINKKMEKPISITLEGKSFNVSEYWIDELASLGPIPELDPTCAGISPHSYELAFNLVKAFDSIEVREQSANCNGFAPCRGSVLIFLPGIEEIRRLDQMFSEQMLRFRWWILPLHSTVTVEEQGRVFDTPQPGSRKIILSTNIAESSVTVPDIKYVIDFCLTRNLFCDNETNYTHLRLEWASKANCKQRKGRAGRVSTGRVYRMVTREFYDNFLAEYIEPEMKRCPLQQIILKVKLLGLEEPKAILALALEPPHLGDIEKAILSLKEVGALDLMTNGIFYPFDGDLTFIGRVLAALPLDIHVGKLICLGFMFGCLKMCIVIAAGLSLKSCFAKPMKEQLDSFRNKIAWSDGSFSDCIAIWNAFRLWKIHKTTNRFTRSTRQSEKEWCLKNFLQLRRLEEMSELVEEITCRLERLNIKCDDVSAQANEIDTLMLQIVIAGAFYPHYFIRVPQDEDIIVRSLSGHDPFTTVMLSGLPNNQGILYQHEIQRLFETFGVTTTCHFEGTKAYIEFSRSRESKQLKVLPMVYLAVKMRQLRMPLTLKLYTGEDLSQRLKALEEKTAQQFKQSNRLRTNRMTVAMNETVLKPVALPSLEDTIMSIYITEVVDCGHFWAHYGTDDTFGKLRKLKEMIEKHIDDMKPISGVITPGQICLAPETVPEGGTCEYHRARVEKVLGRELEVFLVDYGNTEKVLKEDVREISDFLVPSIFSIPMQSIECHLSEVKPSAICQASGNWSKEAIMYFKKLVAGKSHNARIYSVVHNVVNLDLILLHRDDQQYSLNTSLKQKGYAEHAEESILSKQNNLLRQKYWTKQQLASLNLDNEMKLSLDANIASGNAKGRNIRLKGPESPLEIRYVGILQTSRTRQVRIEQDSVNSVSIDGEPQDKCDRMMVSAHVGLTASGSAVVAHDTTLMPNIHGLPALLSLIFAPYAEMRCDPNYQHYTGALCGLGFEPETDESLYPEHDVELMFDTSFSTQDLLTVNSIRMAIHWILRNSTESFHVSREVMKELQERLAEHLQELLRVKRHSVEPKPYRYPYRWNMVPDNRQLTAGLVNSDPDCEHTLHRGILLEVQPVEEDPSTYKFHMIDHVKELHAKASRSMQPQEIDCDLCSQKLQTPHELLLHLKTPRHVTFEMQLFDECQNDL